MYPKEYTSQARYSLLVTAEFNSWMSNLKDPKAKARIAARLVAAEMGNFGDTQMVGDRVSEMRIHTGPGYRVYYSRRDATVYLLLCGGDKSSQWRDIKHARQILNTIEREL
jgi:putative addiction module killer protein